MIHKSIKPAGAALALALAFQPLPGFAQQPAQSNDWFVPGQQRPAGAPAAGRPAPRPLPAPGLQNEPEADPAAVAAAMKLPAAPEVPSLPKGDPMPGAVIGILSVPDVLRVSSAYQAATKELNARGQKLNEDYQKEQNNLRELGQAFATERSKMAPEQIRAKEKELEDRLAEAQRRISARNRIIQEAGQYVMLQINRTMEQVAQQVALSRGVNLVLNRAQILGTTADFDLTPGVAQMLNKILPSVLVPPDGVSALAMNPDSDPKPGTAAAATPASAPAAAAPAKPPAKKP